ncbi:MAG: phosphopyruvate hydratase [Planctomycetales bacterium]
MPIIERIHAREVFDSRGWPTVEVEAVCRGGRPARAIVPSGKSTGRAEAVELRDGDSDRLDGSGVRRAVENVRGEIAAALIGNDAGDQQAIDRRLCDLDGTPNKARLGGNAVLGASLACAYAAAEALSVEPVEHFRRLWERLPARSPSSFESPSLGGGPLLPLPMVNMISGGLHAGGNLDFQDFLVLPVGAESYRQALDWTVLVYRRLGRVLDSRGYEGRLVGDEGGYGPKLARNEEALGLLVEAIGAAGLRPGEDVALGIDVAATHFHRDGRYHLAATDGDALTADSMIDLLERWVDEYPIRSIEDPLVEDDWEGWTRLTTRLGGRAQIIGDDLFATNPERLRRGIELAAANAVLVKPNQIGTLSETFETMRLAIDAGWRPIVSARSGETEDATIADLAVAAGAGQIKIGSIVRSERLAKYNQLLRLEERLGDTAAWIGGRVLHRTRD